MILSRDSDTYSKNIVSNAIAENEDETKSWCLSDVQ
ncbi:hypothetical protein LINPERHAP2_LOCUS13543, partial [Linum perenne]